MIIWALRGGIEVLGDFARRALLSVINEMKLCRDLGFLTCTLLYTAGMCSIYFMLQMCGAVMIINSEINFSWNELKLNRTIRCFIGVHKFAPKLAIQGDIGWVPCLVKQKCEMEILWNHLLQMHEHLNNKIFSTRCISLGQRR